MEEKQDINDFYTGIVETSERVMAPVFGDYTGFNTGVKDRSGTAIKGGDILVRGENGKSSINAPYLSFNKEYVCVFHDGGFCVKGRSKRSKKHRLNGAIVHKNDLNVSYKEIKIQKNYVSIRRASSCLSSRRNGYRGKILFGYSILIRLFGRNII